MSQPRRRINPQERRAAILAAARAAFTFAPYPDVTVAEVAHVAGASTPLVFHYFGSKAALYGVVVADELEELARAQQAADAALATGVPVRDRVRAGLLTYLDAVSAQPLRWGAALRGSEEPTEARTARARARAAEVARLGAVLRIAGVGADQPADHKVWPRHAYALSGYFGFVDAATLRWLEAGCPESERYPLVDAALGALQGALGDWRG